MHHFVVNFQKKFRLRRQGGIDRANQNPADVPAFSRQKLRSETCQLAASGIMMQRRENIVNGRVMVLFTNDIT